MWLSRFFKRFNFIEPDPSATDNIANVTGLAGFFVDIHFIDVLAADLFG